MINIVLTIECWFSTMSSMDCFQIARSRPHELRGRPFAFYRNRLFIFSMSSAGKFIFMYTEARIFIFTRNRILKKQKKKKKIQQQQKGDVGSVGRQDIFHVIVLNFADIRYVHVCENSMYVNGVAECLLFHKFDYKYL